MLRLSSSLHVFVRSIVALLVFPIYAQAQSPQISSLTPISGVAGTQVAITGTNFGATQGTSTVTFNGTAATTITSWGATSIMAAVPTGATTGNVVVTVGGVANNSVNFTVATANLTLTGSLATARMFPTATLLNSGSVLVAGGVDGFAYHALSSAELYSPVTGTFTTTGNLNTARIFNTATLLTNGRVLIAGGSDSNWSQIGTAELYDPASGIFTFTGGLNTARTSHTATLLNSGKLLIVGGWDSNGSTITSDAAGSELYDPTTGIFVAAGNLNTARDTHTATLLNNGKVLIVGGFDSNANILSSAELYDPAAGTFTLTGSLNVGRAVHTATLLNSGLVLIAGGYDINGNAVPSAELYNPATGTFAVTGSMNTPRYDGAQGTLLNNGMVLLAGGQDNNGNTLASAELYDPATGSFMVIGSMNATRQSLTTTLLNNGQVLVAAGMDYYANVLSSAELYQPSTLTPAGLVSIALGPSNPSVSVGATQHFTATGTFSDNSTQTLASVTWTSSDSTITTIANDATNRGNAVAVATGSVTVSACAGSICGSTTMTVPPPNITSLSPNAGPVGASVTIAGDNFGTTGTVTFNGTTATPTSWTATTITAPVPVGATTGNVIVTVGGVPSAGSNFTVTAAAILNTSRYQHSATLLNNGKVLIAGGVNCQTAGSCFYLNSAELYDPTAGNSVTTGSLATVRSAPAVLLANGKVLVAGGSTCDSYGHCASLRSAEIYDPASGTFSSAGNMAVARDGHTMTLLPDGKVLIAGGETCIADYGSENRPGGAPLFDGAHLVYASFTPSNGFASCRAQRTAELYDPVSVSFAHTIGSLNVARYNAAATLLADGRVLITGGSDESNPLATAELFTESAGSFNEVPSGLGTARSSPVATSLNNGLVLITGGSTCEAPICPTNTAELYDPIANAFHYTSGSMNVGRVGHTANLLTNGLVVLAGGNSSCPQANSCVSDPSTESYNPFSDTFSTTQGMAAARSGHSGTLLSTGGVLLSGGIASGTTLPSVELYVPSTTVLLAPSITNLSTTSGLVGASVTITGTDFGAMQGTSTVMFNGTAATPTGWNTGSIVVPVPGGATAGNIVIMVGGVASNGVNFTVVPAITSLSPTAGTVGTSVMIAGTGFGSTQGTSTVTFNGTAATTILSWGVTSIVATVPTGVSTGNVMVNASGVNSNGVNFAVVPAVTSVSPISGGVGTSVTIAGSGFGAAQGSGNVWLGSTYGVLVSWSDAQVVATVASTAKNGAAKILQGGVWSNSVPYAVGSSGFVATTGAMGVPRHSYTATQLVSGKILIAGGIDSSGVLGSAEIYDPSSQIFAPAATMTSARWLHTATLLNNGRVLIVGGSDLANKETLDSAEIYDPVAGTFTLVPATLNTARVGHTATLLDSGQVLIVGGYDPEIGLIADAELYDPPTQTFIDLGDTNAPRYGHTATMLQNGQVLIAGGVTDPTPSGAFNTAELFDPMSQAFTPVPVPMTATREGHAAVLLNNGQILITGGDIPGTGSLNTAEIYDPTSNTFTAVTSTMTVPRISHAMTLLNGGEILINGGATDSPASGTALNTAEFYDPTNQTFTTVGNMTSIREHQTTSLLNDGTVLVTGGTDGNSIFNTAELYMPSQLTGLTGITVSPSTPSIGTGVQQRFTAVGTFSDGSSESLASVLWTTSAPNVSPITADSTNSGVAVAAAQGTATVTASATGVSGSATLAVTATTLASITLSPQDTVIPLGATQQFTATGVYTDGSTQDLTGTATWSSSATVVAVINSSGVAAGLFQGTATIQVNSESVSASTTLSVAAPALVSIAVTPTTATIALGSSQQYQAIGTYGDGSTQNVTTLLTWSSGTPAVATVTNTGLATGLSQGTATLTGGFESVSASVTLTVAAPTLVSITVVPNAASLSSGATQQLSAIGVYTNGSTQDLTASSMWVSSNPSVVGVSSAGLATAVAAGNATITATSGSTSGTAAFVVTTGTTQANLNTSRYQHSATILNNGQILVAGGINCPTPGACTYLSSAELYNPATSAFTYTGGPMATARSAPTVQLNSGKVLTAGGYTCDGSGNCSSLISAEIYDPIAGTFSNAGTMTVARSGHTMTVLGNGTVLIAGGEICTSATSCSALSSAEIYDPNAGTFTSTDNIMSAARFGASAVLLNSGYVLIAGGFDGTNMPAVAEIYYPPARQFTGPGPSLNVPRFNATTTLLNNGKVLVVGGSTCGLPGCPTSVAEIYDPVANTLSVVAGGMTVPRFNHSATLLTNGDVVVVGGYSSCGSSCTGESSTELFDPVAGTFTSGQSVVTALAGHTGTVVANGNVLLVGGINAGVTLASDEWYQPANLTPPGLVSVTVAPASLFLMPGQTQQLVATGTFNGGSTQTLQSVIWNSSNPSAAVISNSPGSGGVVNAQATGASTLTATAGDLGGSASLNVAGLVSLTITPANPSIAAGSGQQLTATGTFVDNSVHDLTSSVTWSSSDNSIVTIGTAQGSQGIAKGVTAGTATITAALGTTQATNLVTVQPAPNPPSITTVSPPTGVAGMQVTIYGSGFGTTQGSGTVWLGSTYGTVVTWTNTQIVAVVAAISQSGTAQVQQSGLLSNAVPFNVNTATILNVSPVSGVPGTQVTITGSGFGAAQGNGQVWLGTANGVVQSWSDARVVAEVASGSMSGWAQTLQGGVWSNSVPFAVNSLYIASVTPNSGGPGTSVTITGTGFGSSQSTGAVWLGSTNGQVLSWSDTQVVAVVAANAVSGIVKIEQNGVWSNAISFTVPTSNANALTLIPNLLNLVVGETHTIQALNASNQSVTGVTWTSSNPKVVSLSTDDPPVLTALAAGNATITAGSASADVTVFYGTLPTGTVIWSNPGDGSGVTTIVPAVPSATGVADVFAFQADGTVQAITSDGRTAWTANASAWGSLADFQGGLVVSPMPYSGETSSITKIDGMTGQAHPTYTPPGLQYYTMSSPLIHTDGTIFSCLDYWYNFSSNQWASPQGSSIIGVDPVTGTQKFNVPLPETSWCVFGGSVPGGSVDYAIIAGDGYAYFPYVQSTGRYGTDAFDQHLKLLRVGTDGSSSQIDVKDLAGMSFQNLEFHLVTNADQGVTLGWWLEVCVQGQQVICSGFSGLATTSGGSLVSSLSTPAAVFPVLQAQDGTFYGRDNNYTQMIHFDKSGKIYWSVPNDYPQIATADGGVIGSSGITYDSQGRATGQLANMPTYSWKGAYQGAYQNGPITSSAVSFPDISPVLGAFAGGSPTNGGTAVPVHTFGLFWCGNGFAEQGQCDPDDAAVDFSYSPTPSSGATIPNKSSFLNHPDWVGLVENSALAAFRKAYANFPIMISLATKRPSFWGSPWDQEFVAKIVGNSNYPGTGQFDGAGEARVWYWANLQSAEQALGQSEAGNGCGPYDGGWTSYTPTWPPQDTAKFRQLLTALGTGIGNAAVHESGHYLTKIQINGGLGLPMIDCGASTDNKRGISCANNVNFVYEFFYDSGLPQCPGNPTGLGGQFRYINETIPGTIPIQWEYPDETWIRDWVWQLSK